MGVVSASTLIIRRFSHAHPFTHSPKPRSDFPIKSKILHTSVTETTVSSIEVLVNHAFLPVSKIGTRIAKISRDSKTAKVLSSARGYVTKI